MGSVAKPPADFDVVIIGAGISGINAAYRIQTELPGYTYTVLESRNAIGGTWDLFRYPGIRSDSDLHTFGFAWRPWLEDKAIADGASIRNYVQESAEIYGIDKKIEFHHKVQSANWSTDDQNWQLSVESNGEEKAYRARFVLFSTGYYDYDEPLKATIPGIDNFKGKTIHPQFWPEDLDYTNKKIVVIGSGATAITLVPVLAKTAKSVTMLQRSPTYIMPLPSVDPTGHALKKILPPWLSSRIVRYKFLIIPFLFFKWCRAFPQAARKVIGKRTKDVLPKGMPLDPNFNPSYNPWEQRLCVCPDADFFDSLKSGKSDIVTDTIEQVTETGIKTKGGKVIDADIIITATGLKMQLAGGAAISINEKPVDLSSKMVWKSTLLQDIPNVAIIIGYTNASWTLGADTAAFLVCRLLKYLQKNKLSSVAPKLSDKEGVKEQSMLNLNSTYIEKAKGTLPRAGDRGPWLPRSNYFTDMWRVAYGNLTKGLEFTSSPKKVQ
ncbi:FAD-containing monooxygenase EthA [Lachnellula suecica]|uniref:FAD-containing monooxygenase EthA n=1 Tax=Lachnellula suecica TaxID=602035 RepID=A0A8T9CPX1_9HELO|nr:FAD-containing monooxygenase EthA [Lachnellula suecica]